MTQATLRPNGVGTYTEVGEFYGAGSHWETMDEDPHDGDTTRIQELWDVNQRDTYATSHSIPAGSTINWVRVYAVLRWYNADPTYNQYIGFRDSVGDWWDAGRLVTSSWALYDTGQRNTRSDGEAWTLADIDALEPGIKLSGNGGIIAYAFATQVYAVVDYTPLPPPPIHGLKVSKSGYDVKTCTDEQLAFSSEFSYPHADITGTTEITINDGQYLSAWTNISHNYGFKPMYMCWLEMTYNHELPYFPDTWSENWGGDANITTTTLDIRLRRTTTSGTVTKTVYYLTFKNTVDV